MTSFELNHTKFDCIVANTLEAQEKQKHIKCNQQNINDAKKLLMNAG